MNKSAHTFPVRVYYEDTDAAGIVYHANYLKFAERARTESLRLGGIDQSELRSKHNVSFVMRTCACDFLKPAMLDDLLTIETRLNDINKVSMAMHQTIRRGGEILVTIEVKLAMVASDGKLARMPESVRKAMLEVFR